MFGFLLVVLCLKLCLLLTWDLDGFLGRCIYWTTLVCIWKYTPAYTAHQAYYTSIIWKIKRTWNLEISVCGPRYGISPENIILYGQSIGTVPTVDLASRFECAAVVLHSPLTSGMRVAFPDTKKTYCFDAFPKWVSLQRRKHVNFIFCLVSSVALNKWGWALWAA